jgi:hypothetical protein
MARLMAEMPAPAFSASPTVWVRMPAGGCIRCHAYLSPSGILHPILQKMQIINKILLHLPILLIVDDYMAIKTFSDCLRCQYLAICDAHITLGKHRHSAEPDACELDLTKMPRTYSASMS